MIFDMVTHRVKIKFMLCYVMLCYVTELGYK